MRNKLLFLFWGLAFSTMVNAQDKLITTDGEVITAYQVDVGGSSVYYKPTNAANAALQSISKDKILMIKKKDGSVVKLYELENGSSSVNQQQVSQDSENGTKTVALADLSEELQASNRAKMVLVNQDVKAKINGEIKGKPAKLAYMFWGIKSNSVLENEDIEIITVTGNFFKAKSKDAYTFTPYQYDYSPAIQFKIKNKSTRTIYLDLGNTFYTMLGQPVCYYVPTSTTTSSSSSSGGSVNLGAVAGAAGIGGTLGTLAGGVNVGGGTTSGTSSTTFSQRVIAIPPMSTKALEPQSMYGLVEKYLGQGIRVRWYNQFISYMPILGIYFSKDDAVGPMKEGDQYSYLPESSPVNFSFMLSYSLSENCQKEKSMTVHYYLKDLIGYRLNMISMLPKVTFTSQNNKALIQTNACVSEIFKESFPRQ